MTQLTEDEQVFKRVEEKVKRAIFDYGLIQTGDRVLIGLSGGKDYLALVELLGRRSKIFNPRFEVVVAHVIMRNIPYHSDLDYLRQQVEAQGLPFIVEETAFDPISPAAPNVPPRASITMATPSEAPLLIPRTDGPASGLRK